MQAKTINQNTVLCKCNVRQNNFNENNNCGDLKGIVQFNAEYWHLSLKHVYLELKDTCKHAKILLRIYSIQQKISNVEEVYSKQIII